VRWGRALGGDSAHRFELRESSVLRKEERFRLLSPTGRVKTLAFRRRLSARARRINFAMAEYRRGAHTVFEIRLYLVWIAKYRRAALRVRRRRAFGFDRDICGQHIDRDEDFKK
jgi:hypothetical protein